MAGAPGAECVAFLTSAARAAASPPRPVQREDFRSDAAYRAALLALEAHKFLPHKPEQAAERAQRALEVGLVGEHV